MRDRESLQGEAHRTIDQATADLRAASHRPACAEQFHQMAAALDRRRRGWIVLAEVLTDPSGHLVAACRLAGETDRRRATQLREWVAEHGVPSEEVPA